MPKGTVKWFNDQKGYGFITPEDGGNDLFVHHSDIDEQGFRTLAEDQSVTFEMGKGKDGRSAAKSVKPG